MSAPLPPREPGGQSGGRLAPPDLKNRRCRSQLVVMSLDKSPHPIQKPARAFDAVVVPVEVLLRRRREQREEPGGVGAEGPDEVVGIHDVALGLRHLGPVLDDHPLAQQGPERLVDLGEAEVAEHLGVEARVEQVQDGVLDAADVLIHRHPVVGGLAVEHPLLVVRRAVAKEVPRGLHEGVHRVGLAPRLAPALRARGVDERGHLGQRRAALARELDVVGEHDREVLFLLRHHAVDRAVHDRDRRAPVALATDAPVAQAVVHLGHAEPVLDQPVDRLALGLGDRQPVEEAGVDLHAVARVRLAHPSRRALHGLDDRQPVLPGEVPVALVLAGHGHDRAGAVGHQHVVGDEERDRHAG